MPKKSWKDLDLTPEEKQRFEKAFLDPEFRNEFIKYAQELSDPKNMEDYELAIQKMETLADIPDAVPKKSKSKDKSKSASSSASSNPTASKPATTSQTPSKPAPPTKSSTTSNQKVTEVKKEAPKVYGPVAPKYTIMQSDDFDMGAYTNETITVRTTRPTRLSVQIQLPLLESIAGVDLEISEKRLVMCDDKKLYALDIPLTYPVDEQGATAKFDKSKRVLTVTLPVLPSPTITSTTTPTTTSEQTTTESTAETSTTATTETTTTTTDTTTATTAQATISAISTDGQKSSDRQQPQQEKQAIPVSAPSPSPPSTPTSAATATPTASTTTSSPPFCETNVPSRTVLLPPFSYRQNQQQVILAIRVPQVVKDLVHVVYRSECFYIHFQERSENKEYDLFLALSDTVVPEKCSLDISDDNIVVILEKAAARLWQTLTFQPRQQQQQQQQHQQAQPQSQPQPQMTTTTTATTPTSAAAAPKNNLPSTSPFVNTLMYELEQ